MIVSVQLGAGASCTPQQKKELLLLANSVLDYAQSISSSAKAVQVAVEACAFLENSAITNCGTGSELTLDGKAECDACIVVEGPKRKSAMVGAVPDIKNPIYLCLKMLNAGMEKGRAPPRFLCGDGARQYAERAGLTLAELETDRARQALSHWLEKIKSPYLDTVGVIVHDNGVLVGCSSSGGHLLKDPGRVGPAAIRGAGVDATRDCMVVTSGFGEDIIEFGLAREACEVDDLNTLPQRMVDECVLEKYPYFGVLRTQNLPEEVLVEYLHTTESMTLAVLDTETGQRNVVYSRRPNSWGMGGWRFPKNKSKPGNGVTGYNNGYTTPYDNAYDSGYDSNGYDSNGGFMGSNASTSTYDVSVASNGSNGLQDRS